MSEYKDKFNIVYSFLKENSGYVNERSILVFDDTLEAKLYNKFCKGREKRCPSYPKTKPDDIINLILTEYYSSINSDEWVENHRKAMSAENILGTYLEIYIAGIAENNGWVWCSGSIVKSIDFIKKSGSTWEKLQIKNRSNSENSSSNKIRQGTDIKKWFRIDANTGLTQWEIFPDPTLKTILSEENFRKFIKAYLEEHCLTKN